MSSFDITRITNVSPLRETASGVPPQARDTAAKAARGNGGEPGVAVETGTPVSAGEAPVDSDRVAQIREALKQGDYPLKPTQIADAIIAARLMLSVGE